jgi:hypothetical protein
MSSDDEVEKSILQSFDDRNKLVRYLQLKHQAFSPYQILNINDHINRDLLIPAPIQDWIDSLPFSSIELVSFFFNDHYCPLRYHRDFNYHPVEQGNSPIVPSSQNDFIWLRWDLDRKFFLYDMSDTGEILDSVAIEGHSAMFNHYNWHGNVDYSDRATLTFKVQGSFKKGVIDL